MISEQNKPPLACLISRPRASRRGGTIQQEGTRNSRLINALLVVEDVRERIRKALGVFVRPFSAERVSKREESAWFSR